MSDDRRRALPILAMNVLEIATAAKISEAKVWAEIKDGELETFQIGDRRLATPDQVDRWLQRKIERSRERREAKQQQQIATPAAAAARPPAPLVTDRKRRATRRNQQAEPGIGKSP